MCLHFGFDTFSILSSSFDMMLCHLFSVWIWPEMIKLMFQASVWISKNNIWLGKCFLMNLVTGSFLAESQAEQHLANLSFWHACYLYNCAHIVNMKIGLLEEKIFPCRRQCFVAQIDKKDGHFLKLQNGTVLALRKKENITVDKRNQGKKDRHISSNKLSLQTDTIVTHGKITKKVVARRSQCFLKPTFTFFPYWPDCNNNKKRRKKDHHISSN